MNRNKKLSFIAGLLCIGVSALIIVMAIELLARRDMTQVLFWLVDHPEPFFGRAGDDSLRRGALDALKCSGAGISGPSGPDGYRHAEGCGLRKWSHRI